jgi:hypothetical protein
MAVASRCPKSPAEGRAESTWRRELRGERLAPRSAVARHGSTDCVSEQVRVLQARPFVLGDSPTIVDFSMAGYVYYPAIETGFDIAAEYPAIDAWRRRVAALPGWKPPYELMPVGSPCQYVRPKASALSNSIWSASGRYCCKSRKSYDPENLAKVDS